MRNALSLFFASIIIAPLVFIVGSCVYAAVSPFDYDADAELSGIVGQKYRQIIQPVWKLAGDNWMMGVNRGQVCVRDTCVQGGFPYFRIELGEMFRAWDTERRRQILIEEATKNGRLM